jgi:predicted TIM-barrel fold metal-dependent hydrolase
MAALAGAAAPAKSPVIDTHIHLFEPERFPYHANATYKPPPEPLAPYLGFAQEAGIDHVIIVHPEPYQDDHRYLEYCFANERPRGLFKGTCLFDPIDPATPGRMRDLVRRNSGRIVALRVHASNGPGEPPQRGGAIRNRDLREPAIKGAWRAAADLGLAIQMHFAPHHAAAIGALAGEFRSVPVILDHMGRFGQGKPEDFDAILALARYPRVFFKFSGWTYSSKQKPPHADLAPFLRRAAAAFGAERILWGGLGHKRADQEQAQAVFAAVLGFLNESDRARIRGLNAAKLFGFA